MHETKEIRTLEHAYHEYADSMYSYGCKFTEDKGLVKDCIHDIFVKLHEKNYLSSIDNVKFYLLRALRNNLSSELSKTKLNSIDEEIPFSIQLPANNDLQFFEDEENLQRKKLIDDALSNLTERQKEAVYLYYIEELQYNDICQLMNMNYQSVRNLIHRGISRLREKLDRQSFLYLIHLVILYKMQ